MASPRSGGSPPLNFMKVNCDFCGQSNPKYRFPHPAIPDGVVLHDAFEFGYFYACVQCTIDFEDGNLTVLVERTMRLPAFVRYEEFAVLVRLELARIYRMLERRREPAY